MKKTINKLFIWLSAIFFLSIIAIDHFEFITIPLSIPLTLAIICFIGVAATGELSNEINPRKKFVRNFFMTIGLMVFIAILALLGGQSQSGIGIDRPLIWLLAVLSVLYSYYNYMRTLKIIEREKEEAAAKEQLQSK